LKLTVVAVGRAKDGPEQALWASYTKRLTWPVALKEVEVKGNPPPAERMAKEGTLLLAGVPSGATTVVLDGRGQALSSSGFAARLGRWRDDGVKELAFLIGGADGHAPEVLQRAQFLLSLGPMTWPHLLARAMLAEQLYRAHSILSGHPYHRA
jgi:23S rRNA (pseudouridine1915-N3)-methyltransferase